MPEEHAEPAVAEDLKDEEAKMRLSDAPDPCRVKYEKLGGDQLISQLRQNEELPKGSIFRVDLPELVHPISMRAGTSDLWVFDQIFLYKEMETDFGQDVAYIIVGESLSKRSQLIGHDQISARGRQHAGGFPCGAAHDFCKGRMDVDDIYE